MKTDVKRIWFEIADGKISMDSFDPESGSGVHVKDTMNAWGLMTLLLRESFQNVMNDKSSFPESYVRYSKDMLERLDRAFEIIAGEGSLKLKELKTAPGGVLTKEEDLKS